MKVAVLALQGAFIEHENMLQKLGVDCVELRQRADLDKDYCGLVLPGGESTVQGKLLHELGMFDVLQTQINSGLPVLATCAGLILLAERISNDQAVYLATLPVTVRRNAYGRQLGSFHTEAPCQGLGTIPMEFIRAPYVEAVGPGVDVLATVDTRIVAVRYKKQLGLSFHPELTGNPAVHKMFLQML